MMISERPDATASSTTYWIIGLSTSGSISFGWAFVAGRNRVPSPAAGNTDRKSTRLNSSHSQISYAVFCLKKKKKYIKSEQRTCLVRDERNKTVSRLAT